MIQIRKNVFETNSSSTHSLCICTEDEYNKWQKGELLYNGWSNKFATKAEVLKLIRECKYISTEDLEGKTDNEILNEFAGEVDYYTESSYWESDYLEDFCESYTSPRGDNIVVFGKYGYDG